MPWAQGVAKELMIKMTTYAKEFQTKRTGINPTYLNYVKGYYLAVTGEF